MKRCEKSPRVSRWPTWSLAWPELAAVFGGAKPKAPITIDGVEWVLKFFNNESADVLLIEHALMALAAQAGMCVAQTVQRVVAVACDAPDLSRLRFSARPPPARPTSHSGCVAAGIRLRAAINGAHTSNTCANCFAAWRSTS